VTQFWVGAGVLCLVALGFLLFPLWQQKQQSGQWSMSALAAAAVTVPLAVALYLTVNTWQPEVLQQRSEEAKLVAQLAEKMAAQPDDVEGWRLLGRSYVMIGEYAEAGNAFAEAWNRTPAPDNDLMLSYAEAQVLADRSTLGGQAGDIIEQVLAAEPRNAKALWYGGQRALGLGDEAAAKTRLTRLLELGPPEDIANVIRSQLAQLPDDAGGANRAAALSESGGAAPTAAAEGPSIRLSVRLGEDVPAGSVGPNAALFIFARDPQGGPPVAVIRQPASAVPGEFVLSDANSMLPGRSLADFPELNLVARISTSGQPLEQAGDLYAQQSFRPGEDEKVDLVIDQVVQ
jgi:cytochrome c-type biogenesis protein CcmH